MYKVLADHQGTHPGAVCTQHRAQRTPRPLCPTNLTVATPPSSTWGVVMRCAGEGPKNSAAPEPQRGRVPMRWRLSRGAGGAGSDSPHLSVGMGHSGQSTRRGPHRRAPVCFCCVILSPWSRVCVGWVSPLEPRPWDAKCVHCCTAGACRLRAGKWRCCVDAPFGFLPQQAGFQQLELCALRR